MDKFDYDGIRSALSFLEDKLFSKFSSFWLYAVREMIKADNPFTFSSNSRFISSKRTEKEVISLIRSKYHLDKPVEVALDLPFTFTQPQEGFFVLGFTLPQLGLECGAYIKDVLEEVKQRGFDPLNLGETLTLLSEIELPEDSWVITGYFEGFILGVYYDVVGPVLGGFSPNVFVSDTGCVIFCTLSN